MKNVMVCVTKQKNCDRLIKYGHDLLGDDGGELFIIHIARPNIHFLGKTKENEALEYLFEKAREYGANLTVEKSDHIVSALIQLVKGNQITHIILGESGEQQGDNNLIKKLEHKLCGQVEVIVIPA